MLRTAGFLVQRHLLRRQTLLVRVPQFDLELRVPARDAIGRHLYCDGAHAPAVTDFLATRLELEADDVVLDIGAGVGWYSLVVARLAPRGTMIHAFEPDPWMRGLLQENLSRNRVDTVTISEAAVGQRSGAAKLHLYGQQRRGGNGLRGFSSPRSLEVHMTSLDDYCRSHGIADRPVGLLKLGVEGFEYFVLRGGIETLGRCRTILTEFWPERLAQFDIHPAVMLDLLVDREFRPALLEPAGSRAVLRSELLADERPRRLCWQRVDLTTPAGAAVDPEGLAV